MSLLAKADTKRNGAPGLNDPGASVRFKTTFRPRLQALREKVAAGDVPTGTVWLVRIIECGKSLNGQTYTAGALRGATTVFEGAPVFNYAWSQDPAAADAGHLPDEVSVLDGRGLTGNQVGSLEGVHFNEQAQALDGYLKVYDSVLRERMVTAHKLGDIGEGGNRDTFGLSIDAQGETDDAGNVIRITSATSVDLVSTPAAGGRIRRLVAAAQTITPLAEATATVRPIADGKYGVFVDGKQVGEHGDRAGADKCAAARNRMAGALLMPEDEIHVAAGLNESAKENPMATVKLTANVATFAGQLKIWADQLSTAPDDQALAMLETIGEQVMQAIEEYKADGSADEPTDDSAAPSEETEMDEQKGANAPQDEFARMSAGMAENLKEALRSGDPKRLRAAAIEVVGEEPQPDEKDQQIADLKERLKGQAIDRAMSKLTEELNLADGAGGMVLKLIDREALTFDDDYREVNGLKEAIKAVVKEFPGFVAAVEAAVADAAEDEHVTEATDPAAAAAVAAVVAPAAVAAGAPAAAVAVAEPVAALGQAVPLRESIKAAPIALTGTVRAKLARLQRRMTAGDVGAMKKHRDLRAQVGL